MQPAPPAPAPAAPTPVPVASGCCPNCAAEVLGPYCHACGQHHLEARLTLRLLWREFAERFLKLERGLPHTFLGLLRRPGEVARAYVAGRRRAFVNPLSYLLIGAAFSLLVMPLYSSPEQLLGEGEQGTLIEQSLEVGAQFRGRSLNDLSPEQRARLDAFMEVYISELFIALRQLNSALALLLALFLALLLKLFFSGRRATFTLAETMVLTMFVCGQYYLVASALMVAAAPLGPLAISAVGLLLLATFVVLGVVGFYGRTWSNAALGLLTFVVGYVGYMGLVMVTAAPLAAYRARHVLETAGS